MNLSSLWEEAWMCLQGHAGQLCSFFYLVPSEWKMCALTSTCQAVTPSAKPINTDRTRVNRPDTDKDDQTLLLSHSHTNAWSNQNTHLTRHAVAHIHEKYKSKARLLSPMSLFLLLSVLHAQKYIEVLPWSSLQHKHYDKSCSVLYFTWPKDNPSP